MKTNRVVANADSLELAMERAPALARLNRKLELCPWCGQPISREKFLEIQAKIREQEQQRVAAAEAGLRKEFAAKEAIIRKQAQGEAERKTKALQADSENRHQEEIKKIRKLLAQENDRILLKQRADFNREREAYQKKLKEFERKLEQKAAHEIGDGAEIDLYEALHGAFPEDRINRIQKGQPGGDILHEVTYKAEVCGRILIDSKNRQSWQNAFVAKLREDQLVAKADHAVLATTVFPAGKKELCIEDGVIVASPARIIHIVALLRAAAVKMHVLGLSMKEREGKTSRLYKFITSEAYSRPFGEAGKLTDDILDLDVQEQKDHQKIWKTRGTLGTRLKNVLRGIDTEISAILETDKT